jgi:hypothetical protein
MATVTATRAASTFPVAAGQGAGNLRVAYGTYTLTAVLTAADIIEFCRVPAGATVIGGWVQAKDIDTGTETLDIDIGWAANGTESLDADGFGNFGVWSGDAITDLRPEVGIYYPLGGVLFATGPQAFTNETIIQGTYNAASNGGHTGQITVVVLYVMS